MNKEEYLKLIDSVNENGRYHADWASLSHHKTPDWYYSGKLGIFIHWGIYSVPGFGNEWYSRNMYDPSHREYEFHKNTFGKHTEFGYKDFIPQFDGKNFDAEKWLELFKEAGATYVMPVLEHHDGFAMYKTDFNRWNAVEMGPHRDVAAEIKAACERNGLTFCASTHRAEHFFFMNTGRLADSDVQDDAYADFYGPAVNVDELSGDAIFKATEDTYATGPTEEWMEDWMVRTCELIDNYKPLVLYFDWWIHNQAFKPYLKKICAYYYNRALEWGKEVTINYKHEAFAPTVATFDVERGALTGISPVPWQTDTAIGKHSWGYVHDNEYKSSRQIICDLIDIVSKNGMMLLNLGPKPDGTITDEETAVLKGLGAWMKINSEGIYDTVPWRQFGEGTVNNSAGFFQDGDEKQFTDKDFRFTYKNGTLYAFCMRPTSQAVTITSLAKKEVHDLVIENVEVLGSNGIEAYERTEEGLKITLASAPENDLPLCFRITLS